jgi:hypothetical protein
MHGMMPTEVMWGMGAVGLFVIIVLVLAAIALAKYVFAGRRTGVKGDLKGILRADSCRAAVPFHPNI